MKIGIYSDTHVSFSSSILPVYHGDDIYTTRLRMCIDTFKWMYDLFDKENVNIIVNCGDLFDSNNLRSEEIKAISECFKYSKGVKEYHIIGNHETLDTNRNFYSTAFLDNYDFIEVIDKPKNLFFNGNTIEVLFLPYDRPENINNNVVKRICKYGIDRSIIFSHIDIIGSHLRPEYIMDSGVNPEMLVEEFDMVINGHLHTPEVIKTSKNKVMNIGCSTSISFVDNNDYIPSVCILDTDDMSISRYNNHEAILFRKIRGDSISDIIKKVDNLDESYKYAIRATVPYDIRPHVKNFLDDNRKVLVNRVVSDRVSNNSSKERSISSLDDLDIKEEFMKFISSEYICLLASKDKYEHIIKNLEE